MPFTRTDTSGGAEYTCTNKSVQELFVDAGHALFEYVAPQSKIKGTERQEIVIQAKTREALFYGWLSELLARVQQMDMVYSDFDVFSIQKAGGDLVLTGAIYGEPIDATRHHLTRGVVLDEKSISCTEHDGDKAVCTFTITSR